MKKEYVTIIVTLLLCIITLLIGWGARTSEGWFTNPDISTWFPNEIKDNTLVDSNNDNTAGNVDNITDNTTDNMHTHTFDNNVWSFDTINHYHKSTCGHNIISSIAPHTYIDGVCTVCGYQQPIEKHEHTYDMTKWIAYSGYHCHPATCGCDTQSELEEHTFKNGVCTECGYEQNHTHTFDTANWKSDINNHWHASTCEHYIVMDFEPHTLKNGVCTVCGYGAETGFGGGGGSGR